MFISGSSDGRNQRFYKRKSQFLQLDCNTKVVDLCACFFNMGALVKPQVENGLSKIFAFQGQAIDMSDQNIFTLKDSGLHDE